MTDRRTFPESEAAHPWLASLLELYHLSDAGTQAYLAEQSAQGLVPACRKGCSNCCIRASVPINEWEHRGIRWYVEEIYETRLRQDLKRRLVEHQSSPECPFLMQSECQIYPMRPLVCRQFHISGPKCGLTENVVHTRPDMIMMPGGHHLSAAIDQLLEMFGFMTPEEKDDAFESGFLYEQTRPMHTLDWAAVAERMEVLDAQKMGQGV